jgi:hypothetical protein
MESTIVTIDDLKKFTSIGDNVDPELLFPHLLIAQQLYIQPVLGDALYNDIISRFDNNQLTGDTQTLYENYIVSAIAYSAWYSASPFLSYKTQRTGIQTANNNDFNPLSVDELNLYLSKVNNLKDFYVNRMEEYLIANATIFPLFREDNIKASNGSSIYVGWKTAQKRGKYWDKDRFGEDIMD